MIAYLTSTQALAVQLGASPAAALAAYAAWTDDTGTALTDGNAQTAISSNSVISLIAAPASGTTRLVREVTIYNPTVNAVSVSLGVYASATFTPLAQVTLPSGKSLYLTPAGITWSADIATGQGFTWRDAWVSGDSYAPYDVLTNAGSCYECILAIGSSTTAPGSDPTYFSLLAKAGTNGTNGTNGTRGSLWGSGSSSPNGSVSGNANDMYYVTTSYHVWQCSGGTVWVDLGSIQGPTGAAGTRGSTWSTGSGSPSGGTPLAGDMYFETSNTHLWEYSTSWNDLGSIQGPTGLTGTRGSTWSSGSGAPSGGTPLAGDMYYETSNYHLWIYTTSWGDLGSIQGATGAAGTRGSTWSSGAGSPNGSVSGNAGDMYYESGNYHIWLCGGGTSWTDEGSIQGATGATGPNSVSTATASTLGDGMVWTKSSVLEEKDLIHDITFALMGGATALTAGVYCLYVPVIDFDCTVLSWSLMSVDSAGAAKSVTCAVDILYSTSVVPATSMVGAGTKPNLSTGSAVFNTAPSSWGTVTIAAGTALMMVYYSGTTALNITLTIKVKVTA